MEVGKGRLLVRDETLAGTCALSLVLSTKSTQEALNYEKLITICS